METQIKGLYLREKEIYIADIFGHTSKGLPGIEIIGLGSKGKNLKEKLIFVCRQRNLRIPFRRYTLCIERDDTAKDKIKPQLEWLELPILLLFWSLSNHISISNLHECLTGGRVSVDGKITLIPLSCELVEQFMLTNNFKFNGEKQHRYLTSTALKNSSLESPSLFRLLPIKEILAPIPRLSISLHPYGTSRVIGNEFKLKESLPIQ